MKGKALLLSFILAIVLPTVVYLLAEERIASTGTEENTETAAGYLDENIVTGKNSPIEILLLSEGDVLTEITMNDYLTGVLLAEMPADFEQQALMAQAIVARTYALKTMKNGNKHGAGIICADSACCQGYCTPEAYLRVGGTKDDIEKMRMAAENTAGMVLQYQGELIDAT